MEKEFNLSRDDAAEMLRDVADSIENGSIALDGEGWKVYHETDDKVPLRIFSDEQGTEIGFKILRKNRNQA
jgi:amphi-Trp domain-containing protein